VRTVGIRLNDRSRDLSSDDPGHVFDAQHDVGSDTTRNRHAAAGVRRAELAGFMMFSD
jgi:hypothetical protein